jgi:hypothetical protein
MGKIFINDYVKQNEGKKETELPSNAIIRFEIGDIKFRVEILRNKIKINKMDSELSSINIIPSTSNEIFIK